MLFLTPYFTLTLEEHLSLLMLRNHEVILRYTPTQQPICLTEHLGWVETLKTNKNSLYLAVKEDQLLKGAIHANALLSQHPTWGLFFSPTTSPSVTSAVALFFLDTLFNHYHANYIESLVHQENSAAKKFNERLGFSITDVQRSNFCLMSLNQEQWQIKKHSKLFQPILKIASQIIREE